jgi:hypothetical protein
LPVTHDREDLSFVLGGLDGELGATSSDCPQCSRSGAALEIPTVIDSQLAGGGHDRLGGHAREAVTEVIGCGHDQ